MTRGAELLTVSAKFDPGDVRRGGILLGIGAASLRGHGRDGRRCLHRRRGGGALASWGVLPQATSITVAMRARLDLVACIGGHLELVGRSPETLSR